MKEVPFFFILIALRRVCGLIKGCFSQRSSFAYIIDPCRNAARKGFCETSMTWKIFSN